MVVQHQQYMHLYSDDQIQAMPAGEIKHFTATVSILMTNSCFLTRKTSLQKANTHEHWFYGMTMLPFLALGTYLSLNDLHKVLTTSIGIAMNDELCFLKGDTPAQQYERGTQEGGDYKCRGCGCHAHMMEDIAHALECKWRSLMNLQELVLAGKHGNQPGALQTV